MGAYPLHKRIAGQPPSYAAAPAQGRSEQPAVADLASATSPELVAGKPKPSPHDVVATRIVIALVGSACLIVGALTNSVFLGVAIFICGVVVAAGWAMLLGLPNKSTPKYPLLAVLVVALVTALLSTPNASTFIVAGSLVAVFLTEMFRRDGRTDLVEQISGTYVGCILIVSLTMWVHVIPAKHGTEIAITAAVITAGVAVINAFETRSVTVLSVVNGLVIGVVASYALHLETIFGVLLALGAVMAYRLTARAVKNLPRPSPAASGAARAFIPFCALGVISFVLQEVLT